MFQDRLIYYPARAQATEMASPGLVAWPARGDFRGLVAEPEGPARGTVLVFHGNAGHAGHRGYYAAALTRLGLPVTLADYPGSGPRDGAVGQRSRVEVA